jgi:predicted acyl esterase
MKIVSEFPHQVKTLEHVWVPMQDGVRLSARIWTPEGAQQEPVPAIFEYIPYRKRDSSRARDDTDLSLFCRPWLCRGAG